MSMDELMPSANNSFLGEAAPIPKRVMPMIFMVDTSGSMEGKKIGAVNSAIEEMIPELKKLSDSQADSEIRLAVLKFSSGCEWVAPSLMSLESYDDWNPLEADGLTDLGSAFLELNSKLSKNGFMDRQSASSGYYAPVIILLSDGDPTDDWVSGLKEAQKNKWYQSAMKIAIAIGEEANKDVLKKCIRNPELLFSVENISSLKKIIRFIAVTSSQIASSSASVTGGNNAPADLSNVESKIAEERAANAIKAHMEEENEYVPTNNEANEPNDADSNAPEKPADDEDDWD